MNLPELVLEVAKYNYFEKRVIIDVKGKVIADLTKEGIEKVMGWSNQGIIFS